MNTSWALGKLWGRATRHGTAAPALWLEAHRCPTLRGTPRPAAASSTMPKWFHICLMRKYAPGSKN